ncbi:uncharacterized protein LOC131219540 [Magnolia sinica]|uniref:uncharacterized protein LOC131219540 n=1 Tax=Magnolia sinica TaxID=86752 RepID=UPI0026596E8E|nr:uncharacterized protein LOC131219540 [Magnolia sinica]
MEFLRLDGIASAKDVEPSEAFQISHSASTPRRELKEQDLLRQLEENSGNNPDCTVDCTLKLGLSSETTSQPLRDDQKPRFDAKNIYSQAMGNYGMVNGGYGLYNRWGNVGPSHMNWLPVGLGGRSGYYGSSSMAVPGTSTLFDRDYAMYSALARQQNSTSMSRFFPRKPDEYINCIRKCVKCETTTTPLWRNGPKGSKSLCNACGIRYKKEERRALGIPDNYSRPKGGAVKEPDSTVESSKKPKY